MKKIRIISACFCAICMLMGSFGNFDYLVRAEETAPGNAAEETAAEEVLAEPPSEAATASEPAGEAADPEPATTQPETQTQPETTAAAEETTTAAEETTEDQEYTLFKELTASDGRKYSISVSYNADSNIPENAELLVSEVRDPRSYTEEEKEWLKRPEEQKTDEEKREEEVNAHYDDYMEKGAAVLNEKAEDLTFAIAFDIKLKDPVTKEEYQLDEDVRVMVQLEEIELKQDAKIDIIHFDESKKTEEAEKAKKLQKEIDAGNKTVKEEQKEAALFAEIGKPEQVETETEQNTAKFDTDGFSVYVVTAKTQKQNLYTSDGATYSITATYDYAASIPKDAQLMAVEILPGDEAYDAYLAETQKTVGASAEELTYAKPIDIFFFDPETGAHIQPNGNVQVTIELLQDNLNEYENVDVVHIPEGEAPRVMDTTVNGESVAFTTDGFSVYVVCGYIVESYYRDSEGETWKITAKYGPETGLPAGVEMNVRELGAEESEAYRAQTAEVLGEDEKAVKIAKAFDISFEKDGITYHKLDGPVDITIELMGEELDASAEVVHFSADGEGEDPATAGAALQAEVLQSSTEGNAVSFSSDEFSIYIVAQDELLQSYVFYNGDTIFSKQVLVAGESAVEPPLPSMNGAVFDHWADENGSEAAFPQVVSFNKEALKATVAAELGKAAGDVTMEDIQVYLDDHPVRFDAVYREAKTTITYYNQSGLVVEKEEVTKPAAGAAGVPVSTRDVRYVPIQDKEGTTVFFEYWTDDPLGDNAECGDEGVLSITGSSPDSIELYPVLQEGHYIYFDGNKAAYGLSSVDYTAPQKVLDTEGASVTEKRQKAQAVAAALNEKNNHCIPTTTGYTFKGWYLTSSYANDTAVSAAGNLTEPIFYPEGGEIKVNEAAYIKLLNYAGNLPNNPTLYAHWEVNLTSKYIVNLWTQKLSDDGTTALNDYTFQGSFAYDANTGDVITVERANADAKAKSGTDDTYSFTGLDDLTMYNRVFGKSIPEGDKEENPFFGHSYKSAKSDTNVTVRSDGTTVLNIRYDRVIHTLTFVEPSYTRRNSYVDGCYGYVSQLNSYVPLYRSGNRYYFDYNGSSYNYATYGNGYYYVRTDTTVKTITTPYGALIKDQFPNTANPELYQGYSWDPSPKNYFKFVLSTIETMPNENVTFVHSGGGTAKTVKYYLEVDQADSDGTTFNGKYYKFYKEAKHNYNFITYDEEYHPITGYKRGYNQADPAFVYNSDRGGYAADIGEGNVNSLYYDRETYSVNFYDPLQSTTTTVRTSNVKYKENLSGVVDSFALSKDGYLFTGWYADVNCKVKLFTSDEAYNNFIASGGSEDAATKLTTMPSRNIQLYAGWIQVKNRVVLVPNGGNMEGAGTTLFHLNEGEKIELDAEPTRDFIRVDNDGTYTYDPVNGLYHLADEVGEGDYSERVGAYVFQGWYQATLDNQGEKKTIQYGVDNTGAPKYTYAYGDYQQVEAGTGAYTLDSDTGEYSYVGTGGDYNFVNAAPKISHDDYAVARDKYDLTVAPRNPVTLVAMWQRAGGFYVAYDTGDPSVEAPEDPEEYIDGAHAKVLSALGAPKGKTLDYWEGPKTDEHPDGHYLPNELVHVTDSHAELVGSDMVLTLKAHYRDFTPSERNMADYTFMVDKNGDGQYERYELQRIAVNEELKPPITPERAGYTFKGWFYDSEGIRKFDDFGLITNPTYTTIYAVFEKAYTVTYYLTDASAMAPTATILATQTYSAEGDPQRIDTRKVIHPVDTYHFVKAWVSDWNDQDNPDKQYPYRSLSNKRVTSDLSLYAVLGERKYVQFESHGGSYVESQEIPEGGWPVRPNEPTRKGYTFAGWFTRASGGVPYEFDQSLENLERSDPSFDADNAVLHAQWTPDGNEKGEYTVIWWVQSPLGGDNYDYSVKETYEADLGTQVTIDTVLAQYPQAKEINYHNMPRTVTSDEYEFFKYNSDKTTTEDINQNVVVTEDGKAVFNIYIDREHYWFAFKTNGRGKIYYKDKVYANRSDTDQSKHADADVDEAIYYIEVWLDKEIASEWPIVDAGRQSDPAHNRASFAFSGANQFLGWKADNEANTVIAPLLYSADKTRLKYNTTSIGGKNRVIVFSTRGNATGSGSNLYLHYIIDGVEDLSMRQTIMRSSTGTGNYPDGVHKYASAMSVKELTGRSIITSVSNSTPISYTDNNEAAKTTAGYNVEYGDIYRTEYITGTLAATDGAVQYSYSRNNNRTYYYRYSSNNYYPLTFTFINSGAKNDYRISYTRNDTTTVLTSGTVYYVDNGGQPNDRNVEQLGWNAFINEAIHETQTQGGVENPTGTHLLTYYTTNRHDLHLMKAGGDQFQLIESVAYNTDIPNLIETQVSSIPEAPNGKRFAGWTAAEGQNVEYTGRMPDAELFLYPIWEDVTYTVTTVGVDQDDDDNDDTYSAFYGQRLKELHIPNPPKESGKLFMGWMIEDTETAITGNYEIKNDLRIKPIWNTMTTCSVTYNANGGSGTPPEDNNSYMYGTKVVIRDGKALSIERTSVDGETYTGTFAYWNTKPDGSGVTYYPNSIYTFRESKGDTLTLYAIYSEYRETVLTYNKNSSEAAFKKADTSWAALDDAYTPLKTDDTIEVLYRDIKNEHADDTNKIPNEQFLIAQDNNGQRFTATRTDELGNSYVLAGWAIDPDATLAFARNGDKAYVNTIKDEQGVLRNTLYAVWGICKIVTEDDHNHKFEHVFPTIQMAVDFVKTAKNANDEDLFPKVDGKHKATIEMLVDYKLGEDYKVTIPADCDITLTTAKALSEKDPEDGLKYYYDDSSHTAAAGNVKHAIITRGFGGESMIATSGALTTTKIIFDGNGTTYQKNNGGQNDKQAKAMITAKDSGSLTLNTGTVLQNAKLSLGNYYGAAICIADSAAVTMNEGSMIKDCMSREGSAVYQQNGTFTMNTGAEITRCNGNYWGGAVRMNAGTMNLAGGKITDSKTGIGINSADGGRGGAVCNNGGTLNIGDGFEISGCSAHLGGAVYAVSATNITGGTMKDCYATKTGGAVHMNGNTNISGGIITNCYAGTSGGGIHRGGGNLTITGTAQITKCIAPKGGGIYTGWLKIETTGTEPVISECEAKGVTIASNGTITVADNYTSDNLGGAIYASGGITIERGTITSCHAYSGGAIYSVGGMNLNGGTITSCTANTGGGVYLSAGESSIKTNAVVTECKAEAGAGVFVANGTADNKRVRIILDGATITGNEASVKGGGIAFGGDYTKAIFKNSVSAQDNTMGTGAGAVECNIYLDRDSNTIIESQGLTVQPDRFIGIYVPDDDISGKDTTMYEEHGVEGTPFGSFTNTNNKNLSCFVNDRNPVLYGVNKISDSTDKKIYWMDIICKITDINGNLLYRDSAKTKPAVYGKLDGNLISTAEAVGGDADSAFGKLTMDNPNLYGYGDSETAALYDANGKYTSNEYYIKMLVDEYTTYRWILAPAGRKITFTTATRDPENEDGYPYDAEARTDFALIKRGSSTTASAMITAKGELILENITLDGGAVVDENGNFSGLSCEQGGSIVCVQESAKLWVKSGATLQNSFNGAGKNSPTRGGGAISNREKGSNNNEVYIETGAVIQNCGTNGWGGAIALKQGKLVMTGGTIRNCYAFAHSSENSSGKGGAIHFYSADGNNNPTKVYLSGGTISNCYAVKDGGGILIEGDKTKLYLSGSPSFSSNTVSKTGYANKTNGGEKVYTDSRVRQDIHFPVRNGTAPYIEITGNLTSAAGSIWVWTETHNTVSHQHYKMEQQFAVISDALAASGNEITGLTAFRNAQDDAAAENATPTFLTGVLHDGDTTNVYWGSEVTGSRKVILRKIDYEYTSLAGAEFDMYSGSSSSVFSLNDKMTGNPIVMDHNLLRSQAGGVIWIGELPYGTYYLKETKAPTQANGTATTAYSGNVNKWFCLIVDKTGAYMSRGYAGGDTAESIATAKESAKADAETLKPH